MFENPEKPIEVAQMTQDEAGKKLRELAGEVDKRAKSIQKETKKEDAKKTPNYSSAQGPRELPEHIKMNDIKTKTEELADKESEGEYEDAAKLAEELFTLTKKEEYKSKAAELYEQAGDELLHKEGKEWWKFLQSDDQRFRDALRLYKKSEELSRKGRLTGKMHQLYRDAGDYYFGKEEYSKAREWYDRLPNPWERAEKKISVWQAEAEKFLEKDKTKEATRTWGEVKRQFEAYKATKPDNEDFIDSVEDWLDDFGGKDGRGGKIGKAEKDLEKGKEETRKKGEEPLWKFWEWSIWSRDDKGKKKKDGGGIW